MEKEEVGENGGCLMVSQSGLSFTYFNYITTVVWEHGPIAISGVI